MICSLITAVLLAPALIDPASQESSVSASSEADALLLGNRDHRYRWVEDWLKLPEGMSLGNTHGAVCVDKAGRVYFNTDREHAIVVVGPDGSVERTFGEEWKGGLHGMALVEEDGEEFLYIAHTGRHCAAKLTLEGRVVWTLPWPEASGKYQDEGQYRPTGIAIAPDGTIFVADGYGQSWIHRYRADRTYLGSFGGPGTEPGKMRTPHGLVMETMGDAAYLLVCDRENRRLQRFDMEGELIRAESAVLERPCNAVFSAGVLAVAELRGRVTLLGLDDEGRRRVLVHLAEQPDPGKRAQNGIPVQDWRPGEFLSPHGIGADARGNLYVLDWNRNGRVSKLERVSPLPGAAKSKKAR